MEINEYDVELSDILRSEEGYSKSLYLDSVGILTGGNGHAFVIGSELSDRIWNLIFREDLSGSIKDFNKLNLKHLSNRRKYVCICMIYQLGFNGFRAFKKTRRLLRAEMYAGAGVEMLDSKWAKSDSPERAKRMSKLIIEG